MKCSSHVDFFEIFANKTRLKIVQSLRDSEKCVTDICADIGEEQSKISHNLRILTKCNIVDVIRDGKKRIYHLNKNTIVPILNTIDVHAKKCCNGGCK